jgi:prophage regulatory protein
MENNETGTRLIRRPRVKAITGLSTSVIYAKMASGDFPKSVKIGPNSVAWVEQQVYDYNAKVVARAQGGRVNAFVERELRFGRVMRAPDEIARDIRAGAISLAELATAWTETPPNAPGSISGAQATAAGLVRSLIDLRAAMLRVRDLGSSEPPAAA